MFQKLAHKIIMEISPVPTHIKVVGGFVTLA